MHHSIGLKMIYTSNKDTLKKVLTGLNVEFQANSEDDLNEDEYNAVILSKA